jgi:hypothetical protein
MMAVELIKARIEELKELVKASGSWSRNHKSLIAMLQLNERILYGKKRVTAYH